MEEFFGRNVLREIFWEEFFGRNILGEMFCEDFYGGIFWEGFFGGILWEEFFVYIGIDLLSRFWFLSRFWGNGEKGRKENFNP